MPSPDVSWWSPRCKPNKALYLPRSDQKISAGRAMAKFQRSQLAPTIRRRRWATGRVDVAGELDNPILNSITAAGLGAFLRDVTEATTKQQGTVESQTANGFAHWLGNLPDRPQIRVRYLESPDVPPECILEVRPPVGGEPKPPSELSEHARSELTAEELREYEHEWRKHRAELAAWRAHKGLYDDLFGARTPAEDMELVFAAGMLVGSKDGVAHRRHLLTAAVEVVLDRSSQALKVMFLDAARVELNWTDPDTRSVLGDAAGPIRDLQDALCLDDIEHAVKGILASFGTRGVSLAGSQVTVEGNQVGLASLPALLLRKRDSSFLLQLLRDMAEDLEHGGFVSEPFQMIVSPSYQPESKAVLTERAALPLPANEEQRVMIDNARREPHLVIQGPPGTGKTHTIANLAAVLMAEGRRVLITAENERALGEVQSKLPAEMQALMLPMLKERGTGPLQASVNQLSTRATATSTPETRAKAQAAALKRLESIEAEVRDAERRLSAIADEDRRIRTFGDLAMPVHGHLIALAGRSAEMELVDRFLSPAGTLMPADALAVLALRSVVTDTHRTLANHRFPDGLISPPEFARWLNDHRSQLAVLGDPGKFDHSALADSVDDLVRLADLLHELPATAWTSITRTSEEYRAASEVVAGVADDLDHGVTVEPAHATAGAIALCEEYLALEAARFDEPLARLVENFHQAQRHASGSAVLGAFDRPDRAAELTRECEAALEVLRRDRSGLLLHHVRDHRTHGHSSIDTLSAEAASMVDGSRDAVGLEVTIGDGAPAFHDLAEQAERLRAHLDSGGKMTGVVRVPRVVREVTGLLQYVRVGGSEVDTVAEAVRARDHLLFRARLGMVDSWAAGHGLQRSSGISHHDWLASIAAVPEASEQVVAACKHAEDLVRFPFGSAPDDPGTFLTAALATVSKEVADALAGLARVAETAPAIHLTGLPIRDREDAARALASIRASITRRSRHEMLPEEWKDRCNPVEVDDGDLLAEMLQVCAAAAEVPGQARTAALTPSAVNSIAERAQRDQRHAELLKDHHRVVGGLLRDLAGYVPKSPATLAIDEAVRAESPIAYRSAVEELQREVRMAEDALRLDAARTSVEFVHPHLLVSVDLEDEAALEVLADIGRFEKLRDHKRTVQGWLAEVGSAGSVHEDLRRLDRDARKAEQRLASLRCWDRAVERLQDRRELRSALSALTSAMDAVPKTRTAKSYPARMRALRSATTAAAPAIPCWVMTVDRVAEVLGYPTGEDRFDVVIIDEASQAWFPAMFLYAIADQVIVVGDKLQTSPATAIVSVEQMAAIAREHIFGHRLEDRIGADLSLYDVAEVMTGPDMMVDHFRCVPEIIDISNRLSYAPMGRSLKPSRIREPGALDPVVHVPVNGYRAGTTGSNDAEVEAIVAAVVECHADERYTGMDFGVVVVGPSPQAQLKLLRTRLLDEIGPQAMRDRDLEVGTASQFQGAERRVMFLSLVVAPVPGDRIRVWPHEHTGQNRRNVQQLNVAVSRARDQLWIFHSFQPAQLAPNDARAILFGSRPADITSLEEQLEACESQFERHVVEAIAAADETLTIRTQVEALGYSIDLVVEDRHGHRLAVECDGDRWHTSETQIRSDLYRQRTLENIGWRFHRFLASEWYADPDGHCQAVLKALARSTPPKAARPAAPAGLAEAVRGESSEELFDDLSFEEELGAEPDAWGEVPPGPPHSEKPSITEPEVVTVVPRDSDEFVQFPKTLWTLPWPAPSAERSPSQPADPSPPAPVLGGGALSRMETLVCQSCGKEWTRRRVRGRKPTRCGSCVSGGSVLGDFRPDVLPVKERNRRLAAALRDAGKEPTGPHWQRAKELLDAGASFADAAREA